MTDPLWEVVLIGVGGYFVAAFATTVFISSLFSAHAAARVKVIEAETEREEAHNRFTLNAFHDMPKD